MPRDTERDRWGDRTSTSERSLWYKDRRWKGSAVEKGLKKRGERDGCLGNSSQRFRFSSMSHTHMQTRYTRTDTYTCSLFFAFISSVAWSFSGTQYIFLDFSRGWAVFLMLWQCWEVQDTLLIQWFCWIFWFDLVTFYIYSTNRQQPEVASGHFILQY